MRVVIAVLLILGLSALLFFVAINSAERVPVNLFHLLPVQEYPVSLVALVSLVVGVLFASIIGIIEGARLRIQNHQLRNRIKRLDLELQGLRNTALRPPNAAGTVDEESAL